MHHSASKIIGQLDSGTDRLTVSLGPDDSDWNPATTSGRPVSRLPHYLLARAASVTEIPMRWRDEYGESTR